jgi:polyribonucleotide nucleotidyltransferase
MFDTHTVEIEWAGRPLKLETGKIARQADGAVLATYGETVVLATVVSAKAPKPGQDFFPLTVNYQEKTYAAGKIPGGYFKREGRPSEKETLVSRLIDRPIRPLFPEGYKNDTQVVVTVVQHDLENDPDVLSMVAASAALTISGVPFMGPVGGARVGYINGEYVLNPHLDEMDESVLDLVVAGTQDAVLMVESEAKELAEDVMLGAVMFGHKGFQPVIDAIIKLAEVAAKEPRDFTPEDHSELEAEMLGLAETELRAAYKITQKADRYAAVDAVKAKVKAHFFPEGVEPKYTAEVIGAVFKHLQAKIVRWNILDTKSRIDGRDLDTVRAIVSEVGILPRTHGSALFTRGETQAAGRCHARHRRGRAVCRQPDRHVQGDASCCTTTSRPTRSVKPAAWARRAAAKSAMASSPGAPSARCCRRRTVPLHAARRLRDHRVERLVLDGHRLRHLAGADGCGRAAGKAGCRHRHGPHPGRRALRGSLRHPR